MSTSISSFLEWFWREDFWLPPGHDWSTLQRESKVQMSDLWWTIVTAVILLVLRKACEQFIFTPIGVQLGIRHQGVPRKSPYDLCNDPILDEFWKKSKKEMLAQDTKVMSLMLKKVDNTDERTLQRWIRRKANTERSSRMSRFTECCWRFSFYTFVFLYGLWTLSDKPWLYDSSECFRHFPAHPVGPREWYYYNIEMAFYLSLIVSQFTDVPKKDFWQMFVHHVVTILLLSFSWACNFVRVGSLVLLIHDFADIPLEFAKCARYAGVRESVSNALFGIFTISWIFSRIGLLPVRVIAHTSYLGLNIIPLFPAYWLFNALLIALQVLHFIWTFLILKIVGAALMGQDNMKDEREESSLSESSDTEEVATTPRSPTLKPIVSKETGDAVLTQRTNGSLPHAH